MAMTMVHMAITKGFLVPAPLLSLPGVVVMVMGTEGVYSHTWVSCCGGEGVSPKRDWPGP